MRIQNGRQQIYFYKRFENHTETREAGQPFRVIAQQHLRGRDNRKPDRHLRGDCPITKCGEVILRSLSVCSRLIVVTHTAKARWRIAFSGEVVSRESRLPSLCVALPVPGELSWNSICIALREFSPLFHEFS